MTMTIEFSPQAEAWFNTQAMQSGLRPAEVVKQFIDDRLPDAVPPSNGTAKHVTESVAANRPILDAESLEAIALLDYWIYEEVSDDPEVI